MRRALRITVRILFGLLAFVVVSVVGVLLALESEGGRRFACAQVRTLVEGSIQGSLRIGRCTELAPSVVRLDGIEVRDPYGRQVLAVRTVTVRPDPWKLLQGAIRLREVTIVDPVLDLGTYDGERHLDLALAPRGPVDDEPGDPPSVAIARLRLRGGRLRGLPQALEVDDLELELSGRYQDHLSARIRDVQAALRHDRVQVARLSRLRGVVDLAPGERSAIEARIDAGDDRILLQAQADWTAAGPGRLLATMSFALSPELWRKLSAPETPSPVITSLEGEARVEGTLEALRARMVVRTRGGTVSLAAARTGDALHATIETAGLDLSRVLAETAPGRLAGALDARLVPGEDDAERPIELAVRGARWETPSGGAWRRELQVPLVRATGALGPDHVRITSLAIPHLTAGGGRLELRGQVGFDGAADLRLEAVLPELAADPNVRRLAPRARGGLTASVRARVADGRMDVEGRVTARDAQLSGIRIARLGLAGRAHGDLGAPRVSLRVSGRGLQASRRTIRELELALEGGPTRYGLGGHVLLDRGHCVRVGLHAVRTGALVRVDGGGRITGRGFRPLKLSIQDVRIEPDRFVRIGLLRLADGRMDATASGLYTPPGGLRQPRFAGALALRAQIRGLDLAAVDGALALHRGLAGRADVEVELEGTPDRPEVRVEALVSNGRVGGVPVVAAGLEARLDAPRGAVTASSSVRLGRYGRLEARVTGALANAGGLGARVREGRWDVRVEAHALSPALIAVLSPGSPAAEGKVELRLLARGRLDAPRVRLELSGRELRTAGVAPMAVDGALDVLDDGVHLTLGAADREGRIVSLDARSAATVQVLLQSPRIASLLDRRWQVRVEVPERRLVAFPGPAAVNVPMRVRLSAQADGGERPLRADLRVDAVPDRLTSRVATGCRPGAQPRLGVELSVRDGQTRVTARGQLRGRELLRVEGRARTPVDEWLRHGLPKVLPAVEALATLTNLPLDSIPVVCERASGTAHLRLEAKGLFTASPTVDLAGGVEDLRAGTAPSTDVRLSGQLASTLGTLAVRLQSGRRSAVIDASVPVRWGASAIVPALGQEPWRARVRLAHAPVAPLLVAIPAIEQPSGALDGALDVTGSGRQVTVDGRVALEGVSLILREPLVRIDDLQGRLGFARDVVTVEDVSLGDAGGRLRIAGRLGLEGGSPRDVDLRLRARRYPLRVDGVVFAFLDAATTIKGRFAAGGRGGPGCCTPPDGVHPTRQGADAVRVVFRELSVRLPEQQARIVQPLEQHDEVVYEDQQPAGWTPGAPGFDSDAALRAARAAPDPATAEGVPLELRLNASRPFWVRRDDFSLQLTTALKILRAQGVTRVSGPIEVRRGFIVLVGKSFDFKPGEIRFDGGAEVNPLLQLDAVHTLTSGETVTARIGGRLKHPELSFSTTVPGVTSEREILELLVRGHGAPAAQNARQQAVSMLSGLTAGLLSSLTRRELGEFIPVLAIDTQAGGATRVRAGVQTDRFIPDFLRSVVRGAYVEGFVGTEGAQAEGEAAAAAESGQNSAGGFLIEFYLPHDLVTSGTFEEPATWSLDLSWQP